MVPMKRYFCYLFFALLLCPLSICQAESGSKELLRASKLYNDGNYKDAYELYREVLLSAKQLPQSAPKELRNAVHALNQLGRQSEFDEFVEAVVDQRENSWGILQEAARLYREVQRNGVIISGKFTRGYFEGKGKVVNTFNRDRVRAIQLTLQAIEAAKSESAAQRSELYFDLAETIELRQNNYQPWRMHFLSDLSTLPDYEEFTGYRYYGAAAPGAAVDEQGNPIYFRIPDSFASAENDGERWRWALEQSAKIYPSRRDQVIVHRAQFLQQQFGVRGIGNYLQQPAFQGEANEHDTASSLFSVQTLSEKETIARLASGIKRFQLPDEHNFILLYKTVADSSSGYSDTALTSLATIFEDRRQYVRAAEFWQAAVSRSNPSANDFRRQRLAQIVGAWGTFQPVEVQPSGKNAVINYRFRNGTSTRIEAHSIKLDLLVADIKKYLSSNPRQLDWQKIQINNVGNRLIHENQAKYLGEKVADWVTKLKPQSGHFDEVSSIEVPIKEAGAYLLKARIAGGNQSAIVLWLEDIALIEKPLHNARLYFVADAKDGRPIPNANLDFFGYRRNYKGNGAINQDEILTKKVKARSDKNGLSELTNSELDGSYQWLVTVRNGESTTYHGFSRIWYSQRSQSTFAQVRAFGVTNQPVYRPGQTVQYALWLKEARYDKKSESLYAGKDFTLEILNPRSEEIIKTKVRTDDFGGIQGELVLPEDAALGVYSIRLKGIPYNQTNFRVEEYKKPEYEVSVTGPVSAVQLGETIKATISAQYLHGAPVTEAEVQYRVMRRVSDRTWFPSDPWNSFYGNGYWWFCDAYEWYPGWRTWGFRQPNSRWWNHNQEPPELVQQGEAKLDANGSYTISIDTTLAKELYGHKNHTYEISATVTDASRRAIDGTGSVDVSNGKLAMLTWLDRGFYQIGDDVQVSFNVQTGNGKAVNKEGELQLYLITYNSEGVPTENLVRKWKTRTDENGLGTEKFQARKAGQYRITYVVEQDGRQESGYVFSVFGDDSGKQAFRFNDLELIAEKRHYEPGDKLRLRINSNQAGSTVLLFLRPENGVYLAPKVLHLQSKSQTYEVPIHIGDMPNFFVEALTVSGAKAHSKVKEIFVPPVKRAIKLELLDVPERIKPGEEVELRVKLSNPDDTPFVGSTILTAYDKALEYISGGDRVENIFNFFWNWRRNHSVSHQVVSNLVRHAQVFVPRGETQMSSIGVFGHHLLRQGGVAGVSRRLQKSGAEAIPLADSLQMEESRTEGFSEASFDAEATAKVPTQQATATAKLRSDFADSAYWHAGVTTNESGVTTVRFKAPENLTTWKIRSWAMGHGTEVGESTAEFITTKNLLLRLQAPRFFVEGDEVVLSANVHNYLASEARVTARIELLGDTLSSTEDLELQSVIEAGGENRFDWRVKVAKEGQATIRMYALSSEESDAVEMSFPVYVHGMEKVDTVSAMIAANSDSTSFSFTIPEKRRPEQSRFELRYSPSLAFAMIDALPYLVDYPYGCTEQTLSRFLPTVQVRQVLQKLGVRLPDLDRDLSLLNSQLRAPIERRWREYRANPVFNEATVAEMARAGLSRLQSMQVSDGGWGWFSGPGAQSYPHTTAYVVHGLQMAELQDLPVDANALSRGIAWLEQYQATELQELRNGATSTKPYKTQADNIDAFVYLVLSDAGKENAEMARFLFRDRKDLSVYSKAMLGLGLHSVLKEDPTRQAQLDMLLKNIGQYVVEDDENQTAYLKLPNSSYYWYWYGSTFEAHAYYLKLLSRTAPKSKIASGIAKYLINNRKNRNYWSSTRDTAVVIEALSEYILNSGEATPDMTIEVLLDGKKIKEAQITRENLFEFDNAVILSGEELSAGTHSVEIRKTGEGALYSSAYTTNFTLEDFIKKSGLEVKVERAYYRLEQRDATQTVSNQYGQASSQKKLAYNRIPIENLDEIASGDLVEIELSITTKNDYEYLIFEDMKPAGMEAVEVQSGYTGNELGAYVEFRDNRVVFFVDHLQRGGHSVSYRMRAEIPGIFSALPTRAAAMYAPEIRANSDEIKIAIEE